MEDTVTINGKNYKAGKLRCKHLRQVSTIIKEMKDHKNPGTFDMIDSYMPFILDSLREYDPKVTISDLDEMTLQEFNDTWAVIIAISGVQLVSGEVKPTGKLDGKISTEDLPAPLAGPTEKSGIIH